VGRRGWLRPLGSFHGPCGEGGCPPRSSPHLRTASRCVPRAGTPAGTCSPGICPGPPVGCDRFAAVPSLPAHTRGDGTGVRPVGPPVAVVVSLVLLAVVNTAVRVPVSTRTNV